MLHEQRREAVVLGGSRAAATERRAEGNDSGKGEKNRGHGKSGYVHVHAVPQVLRGFQAPRATAGTKFSSSGSGSATV